MKVPKGFLFSGIHCGIKKRNPDLGLILCPDLARAAAFFTANLNPSYSITLCRNNIRNPVKAVLVNSGNANCYSHRGGLKDTESIAGKLAGKLGVKAGNILIASTGIIGKKLPKQKIINSLPALLRGAGKDTSAFARSILTTDTFKKVSGFGVGRGKNKASLIGFAKGAGMIYPNMATMLGFILTDAGLPLSFFKARAREAVEESFNSISVDGCMSTNDMALFLSSGKVPLKNKAVLKEFSQKLKAVCLNLAKLIVQDAEGASKFIEIRIKGAQSKLEAKTAAFSLANSLLFKAALYGANANWGRIVSALGQAGIKVKENISISSTPLSKKNVIITVDLKRGPARGKVYTSDLTPQYVKINAAYS